VYAVRLEGRRHCGYGAGVCVFNQEKRVGAGLKTDLEVRLGHGVRWRMLSKFRRETLHGCWHVSAQPRGYVVDRDAAAVLNMLWKITPEGGAKAVWWDVKEARKRLKKGIVSREAVGKANPIIPRPVIHAIWVSLKALKARGAGPSRPCDLRPRRRGGEPPFGTGRGQVYNDTDTKAGF
jgi:hypothetical protein